MFYKIIIFLFLFVIKIGYSNIIYDKDDILITDNEINYYLSLYENKFSKNEAIKNIVLIKKSINFLRKNNSDFLSILDYEIENEYTKEIFKDEWKLNIIRFQKIRNQFITQYYDKAFDIKDLKNIFLKSLISKALS